MYWPALDVAILQIPKVGSTTIKAAMEAAHGKGNLPGHHPASEHHEYCHPGRIIAFVRNPWERFVSQVNYNLAPHDVGADEALRICFKQVHTTIMRRQVDFIDPTCELHRFEDMPKVLKSLGCEIIPHENKGKKMWSLSDLTSTKWLPKIQEYVKADCKMYSKVT